MPDDRLGDLGPGPAREGDRPPGGRSAGERLAELDEPPPTRDRRGFGARYTWVVGVAAVIVIAVVTLRSLPHAGLGTHGPLVGHPLPRFAAPDALGRVEGDPNVKQSARDTTQQNHTPACDVRGAGVVNLCDLERRPLALTFIVPTRTCEGYLDRVEGLSRRFPAVAFAAVVSGESKADVAKLVRAHGWTFPVAVDPHGELFTLYRIGVCATTTFAYRGGTVRANQVLAQRLDDRRLTAAVTATARGA